jgi:hypothetical protein
MLLQAIERERSSLLPVTLKEAKTWGQSSSILSMMLTRFAGPSLLMTITH